VLFGCQPREFAEHNEPRMEATCVPRRNSGQTTWIFTDPAGRGP